MSPIYTASHYLCIPYMYVCTHAPWYHNMGVSIVCVYVCSDIVYKHTIPWNIRPIRTIYITRPLLTHFTFYKKPAILLLLACESIVIKKKVSSVEIPVAKWSFLVLLCCVLTVRVVGLIGVQLFGHYEVTRWPTNSKTRPRGVHLFSPHRSFQTVYSSTRLSYVLFAWRYDIQLHIRH